MKKHLLLFLFALIAFVPTWAEGVASAGLAVNDDNYPPSGNLEFTFGGSEQPNASRIRLYSVTKKCEMVYSWLERYDPGEYVACLVGFQENGDLYYIASPSKSFKITSTSNKVVVDLPLVDNDAYVNVPVRLVNADASYDDFSIAEVSVVYDKMFEFTNSYLEGSDPDYYWFNNGFPMKMFKGEYDFSMPRIQLGSEWVRAYNVTGHVSVKDKSSTFDIDMKGKHLLSNIQAIDAQGNVIDWQKMGYAIYSLNIVDAKGNVLFTTGSSAILPEGDYDVVYRVQKYGEDAQFFSGKLHLDAQSGSTANVQMSGITADISNAKVACQSLRATALTGGLLIEGNDAEKVLVSVYNLSGACVMNTAVKSGSIVSLSTLPNAPYVVRLNQAGRTVALKFVK